MTEQEFKYWTAKTQSSTNKWTEDEIYRLNGKGAFYYIGGEDGVYIEIEKDGLLSAGTYEGAFPHIGEAMFTEDYQKQFDNFIDAFKSIIQPLGKKFFFDMFSSELSFEEFVTQNFDGDQSQEDFSMDMQ